MIPFLHYLKPRRRKEIKEKMCRDLSYITSFIEKEKCLFLLELSVLDGVRGLTPHDGWSVCSTLHPLAKRSYWTGSRHPIVHFPDKLKVPRYSKCRKLAVFSVVVWKGAFWSHRGTLPSPLWHRSEWHSPPVRPPAPTASLQGCFLTATPGAVVATSNKFLLLVVTLWEPPAREHSEPKTSSSTRRESPGPAPRGRRGGRGLTCAARRGRRCCARGPGRRASGTSSSPRRARAPAAAPAAASAPRGPGGRPPRFRGLSWERALCPPRRDQAASLTSRCCRLRSDSPLARSGLTASRRFLSARRRTLCHCHQSNLNWFFGFCLRRHPCPPTPHPLNLILPQSCNWAGSVAGDERESLTFLR